MDVPQHQFESPASEMLWSSRVTGAEQQPQSASTRVFTRVFDIMSTQGPPGWLVILFFIDFGQQDTGEIVVRSFAPFPSARAAGHR